MANEVLHVPRIPMFTKVACGWSVKIESVLSDKIEGTIYIQLSKDITHFMPMKWDRYGLPIDLTSYPSKYYLRLKNS